MISRYPMIDKEENSGADRLDRLVDRCLLLTINSIHWSCLQELCGRSPKFAEVNISTLVKQLSCTGSRAGTRIDQCR